MEISRKQNTDIGVQSEAKEKNAYSNSARCAFFLFICVYLLITYFHLKANIAPPKWDDAMYLAQSEIVFDSVQGNDTSSLINYNLGKESDYYLFSLFSSLMGSHAPLITLLPVPGYFIFGTGFAGITLAYMLLIVLFMVTLYHFVLRLTNNALTGFLSVAITSTMPLVVGLSRILMVEYSLMFIVVLWMYIQMRMDNFSDRRFSIPLGIVFGLGMLMKITFPIYVLGPVIWELITMLTAGKINKKRRINLLINFLIILMVGLMVMAPWYVRNFTHVMYFGFNSGFGNSSGNYSLGDVFDIRTLLKYWLGFINTVMSFYYFVALLCLLAIQVIKFIFRGRHQAPEGIDSGISNFNMQKMTVWFFVPFLFFSFGINKDWRFLLPALPSLGIIMAEFMTRSINKRFLGLIVTIPAFFAFPVFLFAFTSLPLSSNYALDAGPFRVIAPNMGYAVRPVSQAWPIDKILTVIAQDAEINNIEASAHSPLPVGIVPNHAYFNPNTFTYYSIHQNLEFHISHFIPVGAQDPDQIIKQILDMEYIITKTEDLGPAFAYNQEINPMLFKQDLPFVEIKRFNLPDGSDAIVFRKQK